MNLTHLAEFKPLLALQMLNEPWKLIKEEKKNGRNPLSPKTQFI